VQAKPRESQTLDAKARRDRTLLLGALVLALAVALAGVAQPHRRRAPQPPTQQATVGVGAPAPAPFSSVPASPADARAAAETPASATQTSAPAPGAPPVDPPSPADSSAFNGAGFAPPVVPPEAKPVVVAVDPQQAAGAKGPLYYQTEGQMQRATADSRNIAQRQGGFASTRAGE